MTRNIFCEVTLFASVLPSDLLALFFQKDELRVGSISVKGTNPLLKAASKVIGEGSKYPISIL